VFAFVDILLYVKDGDKWADPIPGTGGSMLVELETGGLHASDEAFKMATTDALGVAMKMLGVAADVYSGLWDGTKYQGQPENKTPEQKPTVKPADPEAPVSDAQIKAIGAILTRLGITDDFARHKKVTEVLGLPEVITSARSLTKQQASLVIEKLGRGE
jgi:hypothetical protein